MVHGIPSTTAWEFSKHLIPPITSNTTFRLGSLDRGAQGFIQFGANDGTDRDPILIYDRLDEPNTLLLEEQLAQLEGSEAAVTFGSGMGAISSALLVGDEIGPKDHCPSQSLRVHLLSFSDWLPRFGIQSTFIDVNSKEHRQLLNDKSVRVLYFECVSNPSLDLADLPTIMAEVKKDQSHA
jgi:methionine-gamma-lyase